MTEELNQFANVSVEQKESVKLVRNTKGYTWEIRLLSIDLDKLEKINNDMMLRFKGDSVNYV